jgi:hypothetical protein
LKKIAWDEDKQGFFDRDGNEYTEPEARRQLYIDTRSNEEIVYEAETQRGASSGAAGGIGIIVLLIAAFGIGYYFGGSAVKETIVYQPKTEYINDPNSVPKSTLNSAVANAKEIAYNDGYAQGLKAGKNEGYKTGYTQGNEVGKNDGYKAGYIQGTEYGKSLILDQIDLRVQEAERTNKNIPLFRVKRE